MVDAALQDVLDRTALAARSKLNHHQRARAAERQRNQGYAELHEAGWSYSMIERKVRETLIRDGLTDEQIEACGISDHNVRRGVREERGKR